MSLLKKKFKKNMTYPIELFDKNKNIIYYEDSKGSWIIRECDSNNNQIYFENSYGEWCKREYDSNNNEVYFENSNGFWYKKEYDINNNELYFENSIGCIRDNRPKKELTIKQIEEMLGIKNIKIIKEQENEH